MKVVTNGNPNAEQKQKKLEQVEQKGKVTAPTKKQQGPAKTTTTAKAAPTVVKQAVQPVPAKLENVRGWA